MELSTKRNINIGIVAICLLAFLPVLKSEFVYYDDPEYITGNPYIKKISLENILNIFRGKATLLYVPLTLISYMIEVAIFGDGPFSFHLINLALHVVNALLLFRILQLLHIKNMFTMLFILLFFCISPLVTESVCWATERKDVLYCCFYFLSALRFLMYLQTANKKDLGFSILFFVLSCFSKPMAVTLPALLLVYVVFQYGRTRRDYFMNLVPFFIISLGVTLLTFYMVNSGVTHKIAVHYGALEKIILIFSALGFYFFKPFMPWNQKVFYLFPTPENFFHQANILLYACAALLLAGAYVYLLVKKQNKVLIALFTCWFILVIPLLQLDSNNHSYVNERYLYISLIFPACIAIVWLQRFNLSEKQLKNAFTCLVILFTVLTFKRALDWRNTHNLFTKDLQSDADSPYALSNLGVYYNIKGDYQKGREVLLRALKVNPNESMFLNNYGWSLSELNERDSAMIYFKKAIALDDRNISALNNLGVCYAHKMMKDSAGLVFNRSYKLNPNHPETNFYMGTYYKFIGDRQQASVYFARARELGNKDAIGK